MQSAARKSTFSAYEDSYEKEPALITSTSAISKKTKPSAASVSQEQADTVMQVQTASEAASESDAAGTAPLHHMGGASAAANSQAPAAAPTCSC